MYMFDRYVYANTGRRTVGGSCGCSFLWVSRKKVGVLLLKASNGREGGEGFWMFLEKSDPILT